MLDFDTVFFSLGGGDNAICNDGLDVAEFAKVNRQFDWLFDVCIALRLLNELCVS
jgi:hypothetical protein